MNNIFLQINSINQAIANAKKDFAKVIVDNSHPLADRWGLFLIANDALKNTICGRELFVNLPEDFIMYEGEVHIERYETMRTSTLVEHIIGLVKNIEECGYDEYDRTASINIDALKEEILAKNLGSFTYDW